jgi:hypothetical protein
MKIWQWLIAVDGGEQWWRDLASRAPTCRSGRRPAINRQIPRPVKAEMHENLWEFVAAFLSPLTHYHRWINRRSSFREYIPDRLRQP